MVLFQHRFPIAVDLGKLAVHTWKGCWKKKEALSTLIDISTKRIGVSGE